MLSQAKTNQAWRLRPAEAFTSLYGQITMNRWDREGLVHSLDLLEQLAGKSSGVSSCVRHFRRCGENAGAGDRDRFVRK